MTEAMSAAAYRATQSEAEFQQAITDLVEALGGDWLHIRDSRGQPVEGFPDLVVAVPPVLGLFELKSMRGRPSPKQRAWLALLARCTRLESGLYRPDQFDDLERILRP